MLILSVTAALTWWLGGFELSVIIVMIVGFASNSAELAYARNALALQLIAVIKLIGLLDRQWSNRISDK